ncbi:MAG TPA: SDR family oxidoreductase, partial [Agitococcus sp.]|nr:SDR family oxidoreductase [Agitococcus sp.]
PVEQLTLESFQISQNVNVTAPFLLIKALLPELEKVKGSIINIASIHAQLTKPEFVAYATSKSALVGLTQALAVEVGARVRVNAISPAAIATPMLQAGFEGNAAAYTALKSHHPCGDIGVPEEVANLAVFLASNQARFINGANISINGAIGARLHDPV